MLGNPVIRGGPTMQPVLEVDYPFPTADKPQSKLWFSHDSWWAVLPRLTGPSLWQRTNAGWVEHLEVRAALAGLPGRADVWWDTDGATAVSAADRIIRIFRLRPTDASARTWHAEILATRPAPASDAIETVTLARDRGGVWWIAATVQEKVFAWSSPDARAWSQPELIGRGMDPDDICAVTPLAEGVGVIWSDQKHDTVNFRVHRSGQPLAVWEPVEVVQSGDRNADDHFHTALAGDGTLWVASKNSVDEVGRPQFVLRVRAPGGGWRNFPFAPLEKNDSVSRPVIVLGDGGQVLIAHNRYHEKSRSEIVCGVVDLSFSAILRSPVAVIAPAADLHSRVVDVTVPKAAYPENAPWLVLSSDGGGRVYEADLRTFAQPQTVRSENR
jgi:hypothetical protein